MGIDTIERRVSYVAGALAIVLAGAFTPHLYKNTFVTETANPVKGHTCAAPYHWSAAAKTCSYLKLTHPSDWVLQFLLIVVMAFAILTFAYLRKRVGVAFAGFFLGGWLLLRALRLQRYGDASFFGSSRIAREQAQAKREGRPIERKARAKKKVEEDPMLIRPVAPAPSKRYTPKKQTRKR
jgi:hypothetical protein